MDSMLKERQGVNSHPRMSDEEVFAEIERASRDLLPLLRLRAKRQYVHLTASTVTQISLEDHPLPTWSAMRPRQR